MRLTEGAHLSRSLKLRDFPIEDQDDFSIDDDELDDHAPTFVDERTNWQTEVSDSRMEGWGINRIVASTEMNRGLVLYFFHDEHLCGTWHVDGLSNSAFLEQGMLEARNGTDVANYMIRASHEYDGFKHFPATDEEGP